MKHQIIFIILFVFALQGIAQTNSEKARDAYKTAFEAYNKGNYQVSIDNLENAITLLGTTKVLIQDLLVKSYMGLKDYRQAKAEAEKYFALNPPQDEGYNEMLLLSGEIDKQIEILARQQQLKEADLAAWNAATAAGTLQAYKNYLAKFPQGDKVNAANIKLDEIAWSDAGKINSIESYKKYIADFPYGKYTQSAKDKIKEFADQAAYVNYRDMGDAAFNAQNWNNAITNYNSALNYKPYDSYSRDKINAAKNKIEKEKTIADYNSNIVYHENRKKHFNSVATWRYVWSVVFAGAAIGSYIILDNPDADVEDGVKVAVTGGCAVISVVALVYGVINSIDAAEQKKKANEYRDKLQKISFVPVVNPIHNYYGFSFVIRL